MMSQNFRRVVTGHNKNGKAIIAIDGRPPVVRDDLGQPGLMFAEIWATSAMPVPVDNGRDPTERPLQLSPDPGGSIIRVVEIPPENTPGAEMDDAMRRKVFSSIKAEHDSTGGDDARHPGMHRTETVDYGIVISGEIWLIMDEGETLLKPGDIVVQRGTNHAWANRSSRPARMVFVLLDGKFADDLAGS